MEKLWKMFKINNVLSWNKQPNKQGNKKITNKQKALDIVKYNGECTELKNTTKTNNE